MNKVFRIILIASILIFGRTNAVGETVGFNAIVSEYGQLSAVLGDNWDKIDSLCSRLHYLMEKCILGETNRA